MSLTIALGGDVNFSKHRGEIAALVHRERMPILAKVVKRLQKTLGIGQLYNEDALRSIVEIKLDEYGSNWKYEHDEFDGIKEASTPFLELGKYFGCSDIGFVNLETPLCDNARHLGAFASPPRYAADIKLAGINVVSIANNHAFDAGERGFLETLRVLEGEGIRYVGGGNCINAAREGCIVSVNGLRIGFLAYTAICNSFFISLATRRQAGLLPLYMPLVLEDIAAIRRKCDFLLVAPHFGIENTPKVDRLSVEMAHTIIDHGADMVVGGHGHVPKPIELYKQKLIIYCLGNLVFTSACPGWDTSLIAQVLIDSTGKLMHSTFAAIDCRGGHCISPALLENAAGDQYLAGLAHMSYRSFGTKLLLGRHRLTVAHT